MNQIEEVIHKRLTTTIRWYLDEVHVVFMDDGEPQARLNDGELTEVAWWICLELAFGETCHTCWIVGDTTPCTRECFHCWDHGRACTHHGIERWPSPEHHRAVIARMASEVSSRL